MRLSIAQLGPDILTDPDLLRLRTGVIELEVEASRQRVVLVAQPMRFGGLRWWFTCPHCAKRRIALFLPRATSTDWRCRACHRLTYVVQRMDWDARVQRRINKTVARVTGVAFDEEAFPLEKPKWMRWATFSRHCERFQMLDALRWQAFAARVDRWVGR